MKPLSSSVTKWAEPQVLLAEVRELLVDEPAPGRFVDARRDESLPGGQVVARRADYASLARGTSASKLGRQLSVVSAVRCQSCTRALGPA